MWAGTRPEATEHLAKFDLSKRKKTHTCDAVIALLLEYDWMHDPHLIKEAVVETQPPRNIPARIVATTIYSFLRGKGVNVRFSGAKLKDRAIDHYSKKLGVVVKEKPSGASQRYRINKQNSVAVARSLLGESVLCKFGKLDDVCDAALLGAGLFLEYGET